MAALTATTDLVADFGTFESTEITVSVATDEGRRFMAKVFGEGAVSVTLPKSKGPAFWEYAHCNLITIR